MLTKAWVNRGYTPENPLPTPPPAKKSKKKEVPSQRDNFLGCAHDYILVKGEYAQSICPICHHPDFRKLVCRHCTRPQTDTGTCQGHDSKLL